MDNLGNKFVLPLLSINKYDEDILKKEAFTETFACIMNCLFSTIFSNNNNTNIDELFEIFIIPKKI